MSEYNCPYKRECQAYDRDSICCTFLFKLCKYGKIITAKHEKIREQARLFEQSQIERTLETTE